MRTRPGGRPLQGRRKPRFAAGAGQPTGEQEEAPRAGGVRSQPRARAGWSFSDLVPGNFSANTAILSATVRCGIPVSPVRSSGSFWYLRISSISPETRTSLLVSSTSTSLAISACVQHCIHREKVFSRCWPSCQLLPTLRLRSVDAPSTLPGTSGNFPQNAEKPLPVAPGVSRRRGGAKVGGPAPGR